MDFLSPKLYPYQVPPFLAPLPSNVIPAHKVSLGRFPTPVHSIKIPGLLPDCFIKRDDLSSFDLSGNKVRKLEFLLADAIKGNHDCVITIGGIQSNHARATAVAARQLGLDPYLILRKGTSKSSNGPSDGNEANDIGLVGNLLLDRMVGAKIRTVTTSQYAQYGSEYLLHQLAEQLQMEGRNPYVIPVGGSCPLGSFGYMSCVEEILNSNETFDHIVFACGSGGTAAGLAIGLRLSGYKAKLHAVGVCDSPQYFYHHIEEVARSLKIDFSVYGPVQEWCAIYPGQGIGYAKSTSEELSFLITLSSTTGIILDPVYSGKALYHFVEKVVKEHPNDFQPGQKLLFIHTGGTFGLYDKVNELLPLLPENDVSKLHINPSLLGK